MKLSLSKEDRANLLWFAGISLLIVIISVSLLYWYEAKDHTYSTVTDLKSINNEDISTIVIDKYRKRERYSLVVKKVTINDPEIIRKIWSAVGFFEKYDPPHPSPLWKCYLELNLKNGQSITLVVNRLKKSRHYGDRGTLISLWTHIDAGNIIAQFRSDALSPILESIVKKNKRYNSVIDS